MWPKSVACGHGWQRIRHPASCLLSTGNPTRTADRTRSLESLQGFGWRHGTQAIREGNRAFSSMNVAIVGRNG